MLTIIDILDPTNKINIATEGNLTDYRTKLKLLRTKNLFKNKLLGFLLEENDEGNSQNDKNKMQQAFKYLDVNPFCSIYQKDDTDIIIFLSEMIVPNIKYYKNFVNLLLQADENQKFTILIDNWGGDVSVGMMIIDAMQRTQAITYTVILDAAYSMAAYIWAYGKYYTMLPGSTVMFHNVIAGYNEDIHKYEPLYKLLQEFNDNFLKTVLDKGIITNDEYDKITKQSIDLFLTYDEIIGRLKPLDQDTDTGTDEEEFTEPTISESTSTEEGG